MIMKKRLTLIRAVTAVITMIIEQAAIYAVWRWLFPELGVVLPLWVLVLAMSAWFVTGIILFILGTNVLGKKELTGISSMVGLQGVVNERLDPEGTVKINAELWNAAALEGDIEPGETIIVTGEDGLKLIVKKKD